MCRVVNCVVSRWGSRIRISLLMMLSNVGGTRVVLLVFGGVFSISDEFLCSEVMIFGNSGLIGSVVIGMVVGYCFSRARRSSVRRSFLATLAEAVFLRRLEAAFLCRRSGCFCDMVA